MTVDFGLVLNFALGALIALAPVEIPVLSLVVLIFRKLRETGDIWGLAPPLTLNQKRAVKAYIQRELRNIEETYDRARMNGDEWATVN